MDSNELATTNFGNNDNNSSEVTRRAERFGVYPSTRLSPSSSTFWSFGSRSALEHAASATFLQNGGLGAVVNSLEKAKTVAEIPSILDVIFHFLN